MKYIGKDSLSQTTYLVLVIAWWGLIISAIFGGGAFIWSRLADLPATDTLQLKTPGLILEFKSQSAIDYNWIIPSLLAFVPSYVLVLYIVHQLKVVFKSLKDGNPFNKQNSKRITHIGIALVVKALFQVIPVAIATTNIARSVSVPGVTLHSRLSLDFNTLAIGVMLIILGEIFRMGTDIKEENDLVI